MFCKMSRQGPGVPVVAWTRGCMRTSGRRRGLPGEVVQEVCDSRLCGKGQ